MAETELFLIRHGLPQYQYTLDGQKLMYGPEVPLSMRGRKHVESLARKLPKLDVIYTSPYVRAVETAAILSEMMRVRVVSKHTGLRDVLQHNAIGMPLSDVLRGNVPPHSEDETAADVFDRMLNACDEILSVEKGKKVGIVSHGHPIRFAIWKYLEGRSVLPDPVDPLLTYNYPLQAEAWVMVWDESRDLVSNELIVRDDNTHPGAAKW